MKESGLFLKKSTLIWDGSNKKNKKNKDNKSSKKLNLNKPKMSFFARLKNNFTRQKDNQNASNINDIENGVEMSRRDRDNYGDEYEVEEIDGEEEEDSSNMILGDTEESHLMSVFRAQVNVSEARINVLENELKLLRETNSNNSDNNNNNHSNIDNSVDDECKEDVTLRIETPNLKSYETHNSISQSTVTDATDDELHSTYNPLTPTVENKDGEEALSNGGSADRLLTLSRISLQAKEGEFYFFLFLFFSA